MAGGIDNRPHTNYDPLLVTAPNLVLPSTQLTNIPNFMAYNSSSVTLSSATATKITFGTKTWDNGNYFDNVTNNRYTPLVAGTYQVNAVVWLATNIAALKQYNLILYKNGSSYKYGQTGYPNTTTANTSGCLATLVQLNGSTDYIEIYFFQENASTTTVTNADALVSWFSAVWVGP